MSDFAIVFLVLVIAQFISFLVVWFYIFHLKDKSTEAEKRISKLEKNTVTKKTQADCICDLLDKIKNAEWPKK